MTTAAEEKTDPGGRSKPPKPLAEGEDVRSIMTNVLSVHLKPVVDLQLRHDHEMKELRARVGRLELARIVIPTSIALAALLVSVVTLGLVLTLHAPARAFW